MESLWLIAVADTNRREATYYANYVISDKGEGDLKLEAWRLPDLSGESIARVHNYWLGGAWNFAADRQLAERLEKRLPGIAASVQIARAFVLRAVTYVAARGMVSQFLDLGVGMAPGPQIHEVARGQQPDARAVYVDGDAVVTGHVASRTVGDGGIAVCQHDLRDIGIILDDLRLRRVLDLRKPVCAVLTTATSMMTAGEIASVISMVTESTARGSHFIVSANTRVPDAAAAVLRQERTLARIQMHDNDAISGWLSGLELIPPGIADARGWWAGLPTPVLPRQELGSVAGAVARKR